ncbi:MAG TPA: TolC family protein [Gemmatimonadaceae bacterium]|nr:TolC family protein [Gemmatimonadaceae bacterium]
MKLLDAWWVLVALTAGHAAAQRSPSSPDDSLRLAALQADAVRLDPRQRQLQLRATATDLRLRNIAAERLPSISANGQAQYQSAVTTLAVPLPGVTIPTPPHDTYDARVSAQESIFDPTIAPRRNVERAELAEAQAQVRVTLFGLRQEVTEAFFTAASIAERAATVEATINDVDARLRETQVRFREGTALPSDTASIAATLLQRRQDLLQLRADRGAALARLSQLVGRPIRDDAPLALPDLTTAVATTVGALDQLRARPEYEQFRSSRDRIALQEAVTGAQEKPRVSAFGRVGYGKPGLSMLSSEFQSYWLAGVQVQWAPWTWGSTGRDRQALEVQREIVATNEAAFTEALQRSVQQSIATINRLDSTLALDEQIIALREAIDRESRAKLQEGAITAADYVDRNTDLLAARLARVQHRVELSQARANFLTMLGVEVR